MPKPSKVIGAPGGKADLPGDPLHELATVVQKESLSVTVTGIDAINLRRYLAAMKLTKAQLMRKLIDKELARVGFK